MVKRGQIQSRKRGPTRWVIGGLVAATLAAYGGWRLLVRHCINEFEERKAKQEAAIPKEMHEWAPTVHAEFSEWKLVRYLWALEGAERRFENNMDELSRFAESQKGQLEVLTAHACEQHGRVLSPRGGFKLEHLPNFTEELRGYFLEATRGDFTSTDYLISIINEQPRMFSLPDNKDPRKYIPFALRVMQSYRAMDGAAGEKVLVFESEAAREEVRGEELERLYESSREWALFMADTFCMSAVRLNKKGEPESIDNLLSGDGFVARFHTHPKDDLNFFPSEPDKASTWLTGPSLLFSQTGGTLHVYAMCCGKEKEIYTASLTEGHK